MSNEHKCPICGEVTSSYMGNYRKDGLCKKHATDLKNGKLEQCAECGKFNDVGKVCECAKKTFTTLPRYGFNKCVVCGERTTGHAFCSDCYKNHTLDEMLAILNNSSADVRDVVKENDLQTVEQNNVIVIDSNSKSRCITCGRETGGLLFCSSCYHKYKDKELLFKIAKCTDVELLDSSYEGKHTCTDGHVVKSKSEILIDNYLFSHGIAHAYERGVSYGAGKNDVLHPDFYLPNYLGQGKHVYIEHWGYEDNNKDYTKTKKFKISKYKELGITLICTHERTDMKEIDVVLERKLNPKNIKPNEINFEND